MTAFQANAVWICRPDGTVLYAFNNLHLPDLQELPIAAKELPRLFLRQPHAIGARKLSLDRVFVDVRGQDRVGHNAKLRQKFLPARTGGSEDQLHLKR